MSKMKEMNAPVKEAGGSMVFTAIAVLILLGGLAVIYFAFFAPLPGLDVSSLERGGHTKGSADAKVSIVEFSDFQCPACGAFYPTMNRITSEFPENVKVTYRHFPLRQHQYAQKAAEASECAAEQGKFWEMHDVMFENQSALTITDLAGYASRLGLDSAQFGQCLADGKYASKVASDLSYGASIGVDATPTVYINGVKQFNTSYEGMKSAVLAAGG